MSPIIVFGIPQSGTDLIASLISACTDYRGRQVRFISELRVMKEVYDVGQCIKRKDNSPAKDPQEQFASRFYEGSKEVARQGLGRVMQEMCGASDDDTWGFSETIYGGFPKKFEPMTEGMFEIYPDLRIVYLIRPAIDCVNTHTAKGRASHNKAKSLLKLFNAQCRGFKMAYSKRSSRSILVTYGEIRKFMAFRSLAKSLDLEISEDNYRGVRKAWER